MTASIDYELHKLVDTIDDVGTSVPVAGEAARSEGAVFHPQIRMKTAEGEAELINVFVPGAIDAWLKPGVSCDLYVVEAEANVCPSTHSGCDTDGPFCRVFAIARGRRCLSAVGAAERHFGALKTFGLGMVMSWAGLALLVSFIVIGIPFLIYFAIQALLTLTIRIPSAGEMRGFLGRQGFPSAQAAG